LGKKVKVPRLFAVRLPARVFERRVLPRIGIPSDRSFLEALYSLQADGSFARPEGLDDAAAWRLQELARAVGQNKGVVRVGKVSLLAVLGVGLLVFNLFFQDRLVEAGLERALQAVFSARAEIDGLRLRLLRGRLSFHRLTVADQEQPMRNLFELGRSTVDLQTGALLRGRVIVRNLSSRDVRWGTPRTVSGAIAEPAAPAAAREGKGFSLSPAAVDFRALLEQQAGDLRSPAAAAALKARAEQSSAQWSGRVDAAEQSLRALSDQVEALRSLEPGSLRTAAEVQQALARIQGLYPSLRSVKQEITDSRQGLLADSQELTRARGAIAGLVETDVDTLRSFTDLSGGGLRSLLSAVAAPQLEKYLGRYAKYAWRALEYAQRLGGGGGGEGQLRKPKRAGPLSRVGREVSFPVRELPRFLLQEMNASFGAPGEAYFARFSLQNLSSDPQLSAAPVGFGAELAQEDRLLRVGGRLDLRGGQRFSADLESFGQPLDLSEGLEAVKLRQLKGRYDLRAELSVGAGGALSGEGRVAVRELALEGSGERDAIGAAVYDALSAAQELIVDFRFEADQSAANAAGGPLRITAGTNLDELLAARLRQNLAELSAQQGRQLREELTRRLEEDLAVGDSLQEGLRGLLTRSDGGLQDIGGHEKLLAQKRAELEARLKQLGGSLLKDLTGGLKLP
jgi:uncharacterized protein (TIGR03545 family)